MVQCEKTTCVRWAKEAKCNIQNCHQRWMRFCERKKIVPPARIQPKLLTKIYWIHDVWEFRRKIKLLKRWCYRPLRERYIPYGKCIRKLRDLIGNENPRRTSFSIGQIEISALGVALANNALFALLNCKRLRMDNLWILRGMQEKIRLSQVLTLFHSRITQKWLSFWNDLWLSLRECMIYFLRESCTCANYKRGQH